MTLCRWSPQLPVAWPRPQGWWTPSCGGQVLSVVASTLRAMKDDEFDPPVPEDPDEAWLALPAEAHVPPPVSFDDVFGDGDLTAGLRELLRLGPGAETFNVLTLVNPARLDGHAKVLYAQAYAAHDAFLTANRMLADLQVAGVEPVDDYDSGSHELRLALALSTRSTQHRVQLARELATRPSRDAGRAAGRAAVHAARVRAAGRA